MNNDIQAIDTDILKGFIELLKFSKDTRNRDMSSFKM